MFWVRGRGAWEWGTRAGGGGACLWSHAASKKRMAPRTRSCVRYQPRGRRVLRNHPLPHEGTVGGHWSVPCFACFGKLGQQVSRPDRPPATVTSQGGWAADDIDTLNPLGGTRHMVMRPPAPRNRATPSCGGRQRRARLGPLLPRSTCPPHARGYRPRFLPFGRTAFVLPPSAHANHPHGERPPRIIARRRSERVSRWHPRGSAFVGGGGRPRQPRSARRR